MKSKLAKLRSLNSGILTMQNNIMRNKIEERKNVSENEKINERI